MDLENYKEGKSMQRPPLFDVNCFIYWKTHFETYVKSKDIDFWYIIVDGNYKPTIKEKDDDETIDCAFARFNTIITSLKALDESFSSHNHVRKLWRALPTKWHLKVMAIKESKDLSTLPLDELIDNLKLYEVVLEKDLEISKNKKEKYKSLALKARKVLSEEEATSSNSDDEEYAMAVGFKKFFRRRGKFVRQPYDEKMNFWNVKEDKKDKDDRRCFKCGTSKSKIRTGLIDQGKRMLKIHNGQQRSLLILHDYRRSSTYILNSILIRPFLGKTPYELFKGKKPSLEYFKVFGSKCFILNPKDYRTKFDPKSTVGIFLGYLPNSKAYIVLNKETMKIEESFNVKLDKIPPPMSPPLEDDDVLECDIIENQEKDFRNQGK
nr:zf-CCHC domain-containing protein/UBN2 domain-containing protein [Tanacetum cinerariifolium]